MSDGVRARSDLEQYFRLEYDSPQAWSNEWWASHSARFPHVAMAARKVLCAPATSAAVERFCSCAGHVTRPLRNRLAVERVEKLAVLSYNHPNDWQWDLCALLSAARDKYHDILFIAADLPSTINVV